MSKIGYTERERRKRDYSALVLYTRDLLRSEVFRAV
jgi:hypothetical protein